MVEHDVKTNVLFSVLAILIILLGFFYYSSLKHEKTPLAEEPTEDNITADIPPEEIAAEETPEETPEEAPEEEIVEESPLREVLVSIKRNSFGPTGNYTIAKGTTIRWKSIDTRLHRIACYESGTRFFFSEILDENEETSYTFNKVGVFLCMDAVFGIRSHIFVKEKVANEITGAFIGIDAAGSIAAKLAILFFLVIVLTIFVSVYRKKWQTS